MLSLKQNGAPFLWNGCAVLAEYASVSTKALVELVPGSDHNDSIPKIEIPDEKTESFGFSVNGISITVGYDISEELLSKIMRAARNA